MHIHAMRHKIAFAVFDGFQLLDAAGPASVYGAADDALGQGADTYGYEVVIVSTSGGPIKSNCGLTLHSAAIAAVEPHCIDSLFLVGGAEPDLRRAAADTAMRDWTRAVHTHAARFGSICSGSVLLAQWGLIGARRFATHWNAVDAIRSRWPDLNLDAQSIFVEDGPLWTSAGVTTGIDMTLALIERDHGPATARQVAQRLILSVRRQGWQSQFSPLLAAQAGCDGRYGDLIAWIADHLDQPLPVEQLARRAGETLRSFHRNFTAATGTTPAHFVTRARIERARALIGEGAALKHVAAATGFANVAHLSSAFQKLVGMRATEWRAVHGGG
jgi:transcriptional regulator GlxA family with amidase domain